MLYSGGQKYYIECSVIRECNEAIKKLMKIRIFSVYITTKMQKKTFYYLENTYIACDS